MVTTVTKSSKPEPGNVIQNGFENAINIKTHKVINMMYLFLLNCTITSTFLAYNRHHYIEYFPSISIS